MLLIFRVKYFIIKDIPRSKVLHTIDESEQICERCGGTMVKVGEELSLIHI